jgi:hypothetical protein
VTLPNDHPMSTEAPPSNACGACGQPELPDQKDPSGFTELRPYGRGGALICFGCAMKPENRAEAQRQLDSALDAAEDASRADGATVAHVVLTTRGPRALKTGRS